MHQKTRRVSMGRNITSRWWKKKAAKFQKGKIGRNKSKSCIVPYLGLIYFQWQYPQWGSPAWLPTSLNRISYIATVPVLDNQLRKRRVHHFYMSVYQGSKTVKLLYGNGSRGSVTFANRSCSGFCSFHQWPSRCQPKKTLRFYAYSFLTVLLYHILQR